MHPTDHDVLITLKANFDTFQTQYTQDIKELKDGTLMTLNDHETRLKKVEAEWHDFKTTSNAFRVMAGFIGGVVVYLLSQIPNAIKIIENLTK